MKYYCVICGPVEGTCDGMDGSMAQFCPAQPDEDELFEEQRQIEIDSVARATENTKESHYGHSQESKEKGKQEKGKQEKSQ